MKDKLARFWNQSKEPITIVACIVPSVLLAGWITYAVGYSKGANELAAFANVDESTLFKFFMGEEDFNSLKQAVGA